MIHNPYIYDPKFSIWLIVDPLAEKHPEWSPYNYVMQNPVRFADPIGKETESIYTDEQGTAMAKYDDGSDGIYAHQNGTYVSDIDQQREDINYTGGDGQYIGKLKEANDMRSPFSFRYKVNSG